MKFFRVQRLGIVLASAVMVFWTATAFAYTSPGSPTGHVNDYANVLSQEVKQSLETDLAAFKEETTHEIAVALIPTLGDDDIESYANTLFREWGIGEKDKDNGVLFLIVLNDRKMRIEVGYGLEGALPDLRAKYIQDEEVRPHFREGNYDKGIQAGVDAIKRAIKGEVIEGSSATSTSDIMIVGTFILSWFMIFFFPWFASVWARSKSWWAGGVTGGVFGTITSFITDFWGFAVAGILIGLLFDYFISKHYKEGKTPWWTGGGSGFGGDSGFGSSSSSSSSRGGFGGFGGGSSGGGGSSSSW